VNAGVVEPLPVAQRRKELHVRVLLLDLEDRRQAQVVVVVVRDDDGVDDRDLFDVARRLRVPRRPEPREGRATVCENRIEEDAKAGRELDKEAGVAEPCRAQSRRLASRQELGRMDGNGWRSSVGTVRLAVEAPSCSIL